MQRQLILDPVKSGDIISTMAETMTKPASGNEALLVRMNETQIKRLDAYMVLCGEDISRPEALRRLMAVALDSMLRLPPARGAGSLGFRRCAPCGRGWQASAARQDLRPVKPLLVGSEHKRRPASLAGRLATARFPETGTRPAAPAS